MIPPTSVSHRETFETVVYVTHSTLLKSYRDSKKIKIGTETPKKSSLVLIPVTSVSNWETFETVVHVTQSILLKSDGDSKKTSEFDIIIYTCNEYALIWST